MPCMAMGKRRSRQSAMWIRATELPKPAAHPFYRRLNAILTQAAFDDFVEGGRSTRSVNRCTKVERLRAAHCGKL